MVLSAISVVVTSIEPQQKTGTRTKTKFLALASSFAVIYATFRIIPTFPIIAVPGASFSSSDILVPLYGVILGPTLGATTVILGTYLGIMFGKPFTPFFLGLDFMPAAVGTIAAGFLARGKRNFVIVMFLAVLTIFLLHPFTLVFVNLPIGSVPYNWLHFAALILLLTPLSKKVSSWINSGSAGQIAKGIGILAIIATLIQHLVGGIFYETGFPLIQPGKYNQQFFAIQWSVIFPLYPVERGLLVLLSIMVGAPLLRVIGNSGLGKKYLR